MLLAAPPAHATFPGANGKIAFVRAGDIWTMNPDGTNQVNLTNDSAAQRSPAWSADGSKLAFTQPDGSSGLQITQPFQYGFDIPCTPDPAANIGSDCSISTTADTLVPGTIKESLRTIWQIGRVRVDDAGPDGNPDTAADNTVFAVQGLFVP
jgi:hypothetical protein